MNRRTFLKHAGVAALVGTAGRASTVLAADDKMESTPTPQAGQSKDDVAGDAGFYTPNRAPLKPAKFQKLPAGSVKPHGWIAHQIALQLNGLCGRMTEVSDYLQFDKTGWVHPDKTGWEEVTYWLRGYSALAYVSGDQHAIGQTKKWVDGIMDTQQPDGMFGPTSLRTSLDGGPDFWPGMPLLDTFRTYFEYTNDARILPFMTKYFQFQNQQPAAVFGKSWAAARWGDTIDSIFWLYNRTGDCWLLDLARKVHANGNDYTRGLPGLHNVNLAQGFREPAQFGVLANEQRFTDATYRDYDLIMHQFGQFPGGAFAGDENCRVGHGDPRQGFETCGIVELMHSFEILGRITGDAVWADRCEEVCFNNLPAAFDPQQKITHYVTPANGVSLDNTAKKHGQFSNDWAMLAFMPGIHNYRCCPHNYGMGWPYYVDEMWAATPDGGLAAVLYGASTVTAKVGNRGKGAGVPVSITSVTHYPFDEKIEFTILTKEPVEFPLQLRIPGWCKNASASVNGSDSPMSSAPGTFLTIGRTWKHGDRVTLMLPMEVSTRTWVFNHNAMSIHRGPLAFSLAINEQWTKIGGSENWPQYSVDTHSKWNYGLVADAKINMRPTRAVMGDNPWTLGTTPIGLTASARRIPQWTLDTEKVVNPLQASPAKTSEPIETIALIPMGAARLRITTFPVASDSGDANVWKSKES